MKEAKQETAISKDSIVKNLKQAVEKYIVTIYY